MDRFWLDDVKVSANGEDASYGVVHWCPDFQPSCKPTTGEPPSRAHRPVLEEHDGVVRVAFGQLSESRDPRSFVIIGLPEGEGVALVWPLIWWRGSRMAW